MSSSKVPSDRRISGIVQQQVPSNSLPATSGQEHAAINKKPNELGSNLCFFSIERALLASGGKHVLASNIGQQKVVNKEVAKQARQ